jgi:hypothetical protein
MHPTFSNLGFLLKKPAQPLHSRLVLTLAMAVFSTPADAVVLIETAGPLTGSATRPNPPYFSPWGHVGEVVVGGQSVPINSVGIMGQVLAPTQLAWVIFADVDLSSPVYQTSPVSYSPSASAQWYDSPLFPASFTLEANTTYWIGFAVSSPDESFRFFFNDTFPSSAPTVTANGLTLPGSPIPEAANLGGSFASPVIQLGTSTVQLGLRLHGVPEPASSACLVLGGVLAFGRRRIRR